MTEKQKLVLPTEADARNQYPLWDGLMAYFPAALAEMARLSKIGNDQHNPSERMHWAREKSRDHKNKVLKHMLDTGPVDAPVVDTDGVLHSVKMAWRACAFAQEQLEALGRPHGENAAFKPAPVLTAPIPPGNLRNPPGPALVDKLPAYIYAAATARGAIDRNVGACMPVCADCLTPRQCRNETCVKTR